jgi:hypothetical protein
VAVATTRPVVAVGPLGGVRAGVARGVTYVGPRGAVVQTGRVGALPVGPAVGVRPVGFGGAVRGPFGGVGTFGVGGVAVGPVTRYYSPTVLQTRANFVRSGFVTPVYTPAWFRAYPAAWVAPRWRVANYWAAPAWTTLATFCGITAPPVAYDFGSTTVIENNLVYVNGAQVGTAADYAAQAAALADRGRASRPGPDEAWQPLGVFGLLQGDEEQPQRVFQLSVDRTGVVRGNCYDTVTDGTTEVFGSVDPRTQRVAWSVGARKAVVFETGLSNLTQDQTTVLVHYGPERTEQMALVRLPEPPPGK